MPRSWLRIPAIVAISIVSLAPLNVAAQAASAAQRAVVVTGSSSGIGRKITETLAQAWLVYAGARKPEDLASLNTIGTGPRLRCPGWVR